MAECSALLGSSRRSAVAGGDCQGNEHLPAKLIDADRDLLLIPNLAIHMNRDANSGYSYNAQKDLLPLYGDISAKDTFLDTIAKYADVKKEDILSHDLFLYNRQEGFLWGANEEFLSAPRLDDLQCACASLYGLLNAERKDAVAVHCVLDNEEVGSATRTGSCFYLPSGYLVPHLYRVWNGYTRLLHRAVQKLYDLCGQCPCRSSEPYR